MKALQLRVEGLDGSSAGRFERAASSVRGVRRVDTWPGRAELAVDGVSAGEVVAELAKAGFVAVAADDKDGRTRRVVAISGMTCRSCEITIERRFRKLAGVASVEVDAAKGSAVIESEGRAPSLDELQDAVRKDGYVVRGAKGAPSEAGGKTSLGEAALLFGTVLVLAAVLSKLGLFDRAYALGGKTTFLGAMFIGLIAGSSSCVAVAGGLLLSSAKKFHERYGGRTAGERMKPVLLFVGGRVCSYALLGGAIGAAGKALNPPPLLTGALMLLAAAYMIVMGLDMLHLAPSWLLRLMPRMPKSIGHRVLDAEGREHPIMPAVLGGATFFLPCGFTQALQLYALSSGSFTAGATVLGGFALGTAPMLLGLGWASTSLKGKTSAMFFKFAGALVVVLGLWNVQNGLAVTGHPLVLPTLSAPSAASAQDAAIADDPNVSPDGDTQVITMKLLSQEPYYAPSDHYTVRAGRPVRIVINGLGMGCRSVFQIPKYGVSVALNKPVNVVEFTPTAAGEATFSCSMGMYRGSITVVRG